MPARFALIFLGFFFSISVSGQLTIIVDEIPDNTPVGDPIYIAGDFQGWNPGSPEHQLKKDTLLNLHFITLASGTRNIQFKFTRGNWAKVESDENGNYIPNRQYSSTDGDTIRLQILGWEDLDGNGGGVSTAADNVTVITDSFPVPQLNRFRRVWIYLPRDYENSGLSYPVLYMHDGQNLFDRLTSYMGEWEVDETLNELREQGDPGIIVVGIDNGQGLRLNEYSPWVNYAYNGGGEGTLYAEFIVNSLKPYIDNNYRTLPDRENTGIMGSSLGALISLYTGIKYQGVFSKVGSLSPAYWFNPELYGFVAEAGYSEEMRIYQIAGSLEGANTVRNMFNMQDTLVSAGFDNQDILSLEITGGEHNEGFWASEFAAAYTWLFREGNSSNKEITYGTDQFQIFPNPSGGTAEMKCFISDFEEVNIELINANGAIVKSLYNDFLQAGDHILKFNLKESGVSPGIYYCRIRSAKDTRLLKVVITY